mgnify:CR=1 FL=1
MKIPLLTLALLLTGCAATTEAVKSDLEVFAQNVNRAIARDREPEPEPSRPEPKPVQRQASAVRVAAAKPVAPAAPAAEPAAPAAPQAKVQPKVKAKPAWLCQPVLQGVDWVCDGDKLVARPSAKTRVITREKAKAVRVGQYRIEYQAGLPALYRTITR